jgi:acetylglutamate kinase
VRVIVKLGGEVIDSPRLADIAADVARLAAAGHRVTVVHGAGPQTTALSKRLGLEPRIVGGRRVTDRATLEVLTMVLGQLNVALCGALRRAGVRAVGLHGAVAAKRRPPQVISGAGPDPVDLGLVGDVTGVDHALLDWLAGDGRVPVLACLGSGDEGEAYNINADVVANRLAIEQSADLLVLVTSTDGVRRRVDDPASRIPSLTRAAAERAIADGTVAGGMIPKLEESFAAMAQGVRAVLIVSGDLARAVAEPGSVGTRLEP